MSTAKPITAKQQSSGFEIRLWRRELAGYPTGGYRIFLLAIVVLANIVFTWTVAAGTAATPVMFVHFGMTLNYYADLLVMAGSLRRRGRLHHQLRRQVGPGQHGGGRPAHQRGVRAVGGAGRAEQDLVLRRHLHPVLRRRGDLRRHPGAGARLLPADAARPGDGLLDARPGGGLLRAVRGRPGLPARGGGHVRELAAAVPVLRLRRDRHVRDLPVPPAGAVPGHPQPADGRDERAGAGRGQGARAWTWQA